MSSRARKIKELIQEHYGLNSVPDRLVESIVEAAEELESYNSDYEYRYDRSELSDNTRLTALERRQSELEDKIDELDRRLG